MRLPVGGLSHGKGGFGRMSASEYREMLACCPAPAGTAGGPRLAQKPRKARFVESAVATGMSEEDLQRLTAQWVEAATLQYPQLRWLFHVPNGGKRSRGEAGKLKAMGVKKGVVDWLLPFPNRGWAGLVIELKDSRGPLTPEQRDFLQEAHERGCVQGVARTLDAFVRLVMQYLESDRVA